jgi:hypothetical protein
MERFDASRSAVRARIPDFVLPPQKYSALCPPCEALRRLRIRVLGMNKACGQFATREAWEASCPEVPPEFCEALDHLEWHEKMNQVIKDEYHYECINPEIIPMVVDFAAPIEVRSHRQDAFEYYGFNRPKIGLFGQMCAHGLEDIHFIDILFDVTKYTHDAGLFGDCINQATKAVEKGEATTYSYYSDTDHVQRSGEALYHVLYGDLTLGPQDRTKLTFWAEYHGKSSLDAHFSRLKRIADDYDLQIGEQQSQSTEDVMAGLKLAFEKQCKNTTVLIFDDTCRVDRKKVLIKNISSFHFFELTRNGKCFVEKKALDTKVADVNPKTEKKDAKKDQFILREYENIVKNIATRRDILKDYPSSLLMLKK